MFVVNTGCFNIDLTNGGRIAQGYRQRAKHMNSSKSSIVYCK